VTDLWTSDEIAQATGGVASAPFVVSGVAFDSREVTGGDLFVAMKGETTDGHHFVEKAFNQGAAGAIVSEPIAHPHILVKDSAAALEALGRASRSRMQGKVVGVTGSVGKTGTKEALFQALDRICPGNVHRSVKSYNNHVGVPLSLSRMPRTSAFGVFEMGMNHAGELAQLTQQVRPHVAIVTAIAPAHIEFFGTEEKIAQAKAEIFEGLEPEGIAILPNDTPHRDRLVKAARRHAEQIITFGGGDADVHAVHAVIAESGGSLISAALLERELTFTIAQRGEHWVTNALAVLATVEALGADVAIAGLALADMAGLKGRGERHTLELAGGEALLIDESYNANPASMAATLKSLGGEKQATRRIAVLGPMRELGTHSAQLHADLAPAVLDAHVDQLILIGEEMRPLAEQVVGKVSLDFVDTVEQATNELLHRVRPGDAVLVKASNSVGLAKLVERVVEAQPCST